MSVPILMQRRATIIAFCSLAGCAALEPPPPMQVTYQCDRDRSFGVAFHPSGESAIIEIDRMRFALRHEPSASGAKYACDVLTLWTKGPDAFVEMDGVREYTNCRQMRRP